MNQEVLNDIASNLQVSYKVLDNLKDGQKTYRAVINLTNHSSHSLGFDHWELYFCHLRMIEPGHLPKSSSYKNHEAGVKFIHVNGGLFKLSPLKTFKTLCKGDKVAIKIKAEHYSVARTDFLPNWYMTYLKLEPALVECTVREELSFIEPFDTPEAWKRFDYTVKHGSKRFDYYNPFNVQERFERNKCANVKLCDTSLPVIPTPLHAKVGEGKVSVNPEEWIITGEEDCKEKAQYLSVKTKIPIGENASKKTVTLKLSPELGIGDRKPSDESYTLVIQSEPATINVTASDQAGLFYGIQTLLSLLHDTQDSVPVCTIEDAPRYGYRGMHMDVSRNFHTKEQILKLLDVMAMYKMNKFHFHLSDDEGWRLEIPGLEELVTVGSRRGHVTNLENKKVIKSLLPLLGSGPGFNSSGTGHYSVNEYREILEYAKQRHIEVIPEIDMPGHSHAAIRSMKARYLKFVDLDEVDKAMEYLLTDLDHDEIDGSHSVQMFSENAMNPGLESTYRFVKKVVSEVKKMHADIMPLKTFHFGGDEVPYEAWEGSAACNELVKTGTINSLKDLMEYFVTRTGNIIAGCDLDTGAWQDGIIPDEVVLEPICRDKFRSKDVLVYAWQNVWESGLAGSSYRLANAGYKVVMAQGTHLYFDHPYEPDPEERGLYWACRFMDTRKVFTFMPDNIYGNVDVKLTGEPLPDNYIEKHKDDHDNLLEPDNVIGIQGQLWTELVRTADQMDCMIFPRLLCVAERAWHKADWEAESDRDKLQDGQSLDWSRFAQILGCKELRRLDERGVAYHLPPPGAHCCADDGKLELNSAYPGLPLYYSKDSGITWTEYTDKIEVNPEKDLHLCTRSVDGKRSSRIVTMKKV